MLITGGIRLEGAVVCKEERKALVALRQVISVLHLLGQESPEVHPHLPPPREHMNIGPVVDPIEIGVVKSLQHWRDDGSLVALIFTKLFVKPTCYTTTMDRFRDLHVEVEIEVECHILDRSIAGR
ncbi:hypothetical protein Hypma_006313 [Hypsizygus marmoreus]|uniref:Uncharacterized protein n=1 Tax=Hypsizygus marmoreus TaxID=39966 RepID=A0A369JT60_HYPMA|nr:hypothetical protein Hypma_006313 [Hypsizygus marmoreus]